MQFEGFLSLILEEKDLKQLCLYNYNFLLVGFEHSKVDLCMLRKKKQQMFKNKKKSLIPTYLP